MFKAHVTSTRLTAILTGAARAAPTTTQKGLCLRRRPGPHDSRPHGPRTGPDMGRTHSVNTFVVGAIGPRANVLKVHAVFFSPFEVSLCFISMYQDVHI